MKLTPLPASIAFVCLLVLCASACSSAPGEMAAGDGQVKTAVQSVDDPAPAQTRPTGIAGSEPGNEQEQEASSEAVRGDGDSSADAAGLSGAGANSAAVDELEIPISPVNSFLGLLAPSEAEARARQAEEQERVATCMRRRGFAYVPFVSFSGQPLQPPDGVQIDSPEYRAAYGFGLTTLLYPAEVAEPELRGHSSEALQRWVESEADPNNALLDSLSPAEAEAFSRALFFYPDPGDESQPGCYAEVRASDGQTARVNDFYGRFAEDLAAIEQRSRADPRFLAKEAEVDACIVDRGYRPHRYLSDLQSELESRRYDAFRSLDQPYLNRDVSEGPWDWFSRVEAPELSDDYKLALAAIQEYEIGVAAAQVGCGVDEQGRLLVELIYENETRFLENNAEAIEAFRGPGSN